MPFRGPLYEAMPDDELVELYKKTPIPAVFITLHDRHSKAIYRQCFAFSKQSPGWAEEKQQQIFRHAQQQISQYTRKDHDGDRKEDSKFLAWLRRIAKDRCLEELAGREEDDSSTACPRPAILWLLTRPGQADPATVTHLRDHLRTCRSCAEIASRLQAFDDASRPGLEELPPGEWDRVKPLLQRWMSEFLNAPPSPATSATPAQPSSPLRAASLNPAASPHKPFSWRSPRLTWALKLGLTGSVAALLVLGVVLLQRTGRPADVPAVETAAPMHHPSDRSQTPGQPGDHSVLVSGRKDSPPAPRETDPESLNFTEGELLKLHVASVEQQRDGTYRIEGRFIPTAATRGPLASAEITGVWTPGTAEGSSSLQICEITADGKSYRPLLSTEERQLMTRMELEGEEMPQAGQTVQLEVLGSQSLMKFEP